MDIEYVRELRSAAIKWFNKISKDRSRTGIYSNEEIMAMNSVIMQMADEIIKLKEDKK